jgi:hypothetical protein
VRASDESRTEALPRKRGRRKASEEPVTSEEE